MNDTQSIINRPGIAFKGIIPSAFARMVNDEFQEKMGAEAEVKVTAPPVLIRNRKARPDSWETEMIADAAVAARLAQGAVAAGAGAESRPRCVPLPDPRVLRSLLPVLPRLAQGRDRHHRLSEGRRQGGRPRRCHQHLDPPTVAFRTQGKTPHARFAIDDQGKARAAPCGGVSDRAFGQPVSRVQGLRQCSPPGCRGGIHRRARRGECGQCRVRRSEILAYGLCAQPAQRIRTAGDWRHAMLSRGSSRGSPATIRKPLATYATS